MASEAEADAAPGGKVTVAAREEASKMRLRSLCATRPQLRIMLRPCTAIEEDEQDLVLMPSAAAPSVLWASVEFDLREDERSVTTRGISNFLDASALGKSIQFNLTICKKLRMGPSLVRVRKLVSGFGSSKKFEVRTEVIL